MSRKLLALAWIVPALPSLAQVQPALTEILQVPSRTAVFGQHMTASPSRSAFVVYAEAVEESPSGLLNSLGVIETSGTVRYPLSPVPALYATVADDGSAWAVGYQSATDTQPILSGVDPEGAVRWSYAIDAAPGGMALDARGNLLLTGSAGPGSRFAGVPADAPGSLAFVADLDAATGATLWVRTFGGTRCGDSSCASSPGQRTSAGPLAVLPNGDIWVAGFTNASDLPVTAGALASRFPGAGSWLARFAGDGTLRYATYLFSRSDTPIGMTLGPDSSIYLASRATTVAVAGVRPLERTAHLQNQRVSRLSWLESSHGIGYYTIFGKLDPSGSKLEYTSNQPWNIDQLNLGVDSQGRLLGAYGYFVTNGFWFAPDGSLGGAVAFPKYLLNVVTAAGDSIYGFVAAQPNGDPLAQDFVYRWKIPDAPGPSVGWTASSEGSVLIERAAPGELVSFYGAGLGPQAGVTAAFDPNGHLPVNLAGTRVLFDGKPAPLLYTGDTQVNAIVPYGVAGRQSTTVQVCAGSCAPAFDLRVVAAHPNLFTVPDTPAGTRAAAFNVNGVPNSSADPARPGSVVTLFLTGAGAPATPVADGAIGVPFQGVPAQPIRVSVSGQTGGVLYAGSLSGAVNGVVQLNLKLPDFDVPAVSKQTLTVTVGDSPAQAGIYLWNGGH